jgi:4-amino-4-deoxy-L-arabinose transferase-like glycosyltransferase
MPSIRSFRPRPRPAAATALRGAVAVPRARTGAPGAGRLRARVLGLPRPRPELAALLVLAGALNLWALSRNGWANEYYSAAVRSMTSSWHDLLYGSFDAAGVMTVDKPPLALWVQAASAKVFGFHALSLLVPQALMGVASVALVHDLTRRHFGRRAGFVAGLVLATTPITVAISRHNNPDALLVLCCVAALWFLARALQEGRTRWLVLAGVAVGLGFETKMAAALMVVPGIAAAWVWVAPGGRRAALGQLLAGGAAMVAVGGAWPLLMALTPAADRPWVSGTSDNSIVSLILGYNGLGRLAGQAGGPQSFERGGGGGGVFGGPTGPLRLLDSSVGGQAGWLLGFALVAGAAILAATRLRRTDARTGWLIAVGGAFLTSAVAFSYASGIFHPYYVSLLAPFTAALVGAGAAQLPDARVLAPLAVAAGVAGELVVLHNNPGRLTWLAPVLVVAGVLAAAALAARVPARLRAVALAGILAALVLAPATWAVQTLGHATSGTFPAGGPVAAGFAGGPGAGGRGGAGGPGGGALAPPGAPPAGAGPANANRGGGLGAGPRMGGGGAFGGDSAALTQAVAYARRHGGGTIAVSSQSGASRTIIASGADVAAIGGFSGRESEVSVTWLADAVRAGRVRWVLTGGDGRGGRGGIGGDGRVGSSAVMAAVAQTCTPVSTGSASSRTTGNDTATASGLYDCRGHADDLASAAAG